MEDKYVEYVEANAHEYQDIQENKPKKSPKAPRLQIVRSEIKPTGEAIQTIRPIAKSKESSEDIVKRLINQYGQRSAYDQSEMTDFNMVKTAFPNVAGQILNSYDGAQLATDSKQDLVGERYLSEQIRIVNEENKKKSILDKWSHLLYEGEDEKTYKTAATITSPINDYSTYTPVKSEVYNFNQIKNQEFSYDDDYYKF